MFTQSMKQAQRLYSSSIKLDYKFSPQSRKKARQKQTKIITLNNKPHETLTRSQVLRHKQQMQIFAYKYHLPRLSNPELQSQRGISRGAQSRRSLVFSVHSDTKSLNQHEKKLLEVERKINKKTQSRQQQRQKKKDKNEIEHRRSDLFKSNQLLKTRSQSDIKFLQGCHQESIKMIRIQKQKDAKKQQQRINQEVKKTRETIIFKEYIKKKSYNELNKFLESKKIFITNKMPQKKKEEPINYKNYLSQKNFNSERKPIPQNQTKKKFLLKSQRNESNQKMLKSKSITIRKVYNLKKK